MAGSARNSVSTGRLVRLTAVMVPRHADERRSGKMSWRTVYSDDTRLGQAGERLVRHLPSFNSFFGFVHLGVRVQYVGVVEERAAKGHGREEESGHREPAADLPAPPCDDFPRSPRSFGAANEYEQAETREQKAHRDRVAART